MVVVDKQQLYRQIPSVHDMLQWPVFHDCTHDFAIQIVHNTIVESQPAAHAAQSAEEHDKPKAE